MAQNNRKTKIVNPHFQYKAAFSTVLVAILVVNFFILLVSLAPDLLGFVFQQHYSSYYIVGIVEVLLILLCWKWSISSTHRLAGPVYAIDRELRKLGDGNLTCHIQLRPGDEFQEAAETINNSIGHLREKIAAIKAAAKAVEMDPSPVNLDGLNNALSSLVTDVDQLAEPATGGRG